jgi:hypothetical protein
LPFFTPLLREGAHLEVYAPPHGDETVTEVFERTFTPPLFPVALSALPGSVTCHDVGDDEFDVGGFRVVSRRVPHVGPTCGLPGRVGRPVGHLPERSPAAARRFVLGPRRGHSNSVVASTC